jgi:hypothetical protein
LKKLPWDRIAKVAIPTSSEFIKPSELKASSIKHVTQTAFYVLFPVNLSIKYKEKSSAVPE